MNLKQEELQELNTLIKQSGLDLPEFRRKVDCTGLNYKWLQKNIEVRNQNIPDRLKELLNLKEKKNDKQKQTAS